MGVGIGCDIGGTFTDFIVIDKDSGAVSVEKVLTTPTDPSRAVEEGLRNLEASNPGCISGTEIIVHGTTLVINAVIERKGAKTGLITTRGFRDILEIAREKRYDGNDLQIRFPEPLVPRPLRTEVDERVHASGRVLKALDEQSVVGAVEHLLAQGVQSIAVCLINSYANADHERKVGEIITRLAPSMPVTLSYEVLRELKEYERSTTTIVNAYTKPIVSKYLATLQDRLNTLNCTGELMLMQSGGGLNSAEMARRFPVQIIESGPAAGIIGAAHYAKLAGYRKILSFDMGGTTAKMCLVKEGRVITVNQLEVARIHRFKRGSGIPVRVSVVDMTEIGAGGGSIAKVSAKGTLEIGPESASADPGPVCYARGGTQPTVSDADLLLGYLNPDFFLGGRMTLNKVLAEAAINTRLARPLGLTNEEVAWGIHSVANENMAAAAKVYIAEKGDSPNDCAIVAFGGAGPVHACDLARRIGAAVIVVPPRAGVASAFGMLIAPASYHTVRTHRVCSSKADLSRITGIFKELEQEARSNLPKKTVPGKVWFEHCADMRYIGQGYDIVVPFEPETLDKLTNELIRHNFNQAYHTLYGRVFDDLEIEFMSLRVTAYAPGKEFSENLFSTISSRELPFTVRDAYCPISKQFIPHKVYNRSDLSKGATLSGPSIIEESESTTIVDQNARLTVDDFGSLVVTLEHQHAAPVRETADAEQLNPVSLEMIWRRLSSTVDELSAALLRTSFSTVVRDVNDYACAIFDNKTRLLVQSVDSTPGIFGGLRPMLRHMLSKCPPETLRDGDVLIGNDPWNGSGHHNDIFTVTPAFYNRVLIGYAACAVHHVDIGGRRSTTESRDNYEEGLRIPVGKIIREGEPNEDYFNFISANVRLPETVLGDLRAQFSANHVGCERLRDLCAERGWRDIQHLADEIVSRSEEVARSEILMIPDGIYRHEAPIDIIDGNAIVLRVAVTVRGDELTVDFGGSSPQVRPAINCTLTYTAGYTNFAVGALLNLPVPINEGTLAPIKVVADPGTVVNALFPAPLFARTGIGNFIPEMIFTALAGVLPDRVVAGCGATPLWAQYFFGKRNDGSKFAPLNCANGGLGGRATQDGVSCLTFPGNIGNIPVEILESEIPVLVTRRELWPDSAGAGRFRGGLGQQFEMRILSGDLGPQGPILVGFRGGRFYYPVPGLLGGAASPNGRLLINGETMVGGKDVSVAPEGTIVCQIPGGGGYGDPAQRDRALIERDLEFGYITLGHAKEKYGYMESAEKTTLQ